MQDLSCKEVEEYLISRLSGITVVNILVEFPSKQKALHVEGENDYYIFQEQNGCYHLIDARRQKKLCDSDPQLFMKQLVQIILEEEENVPAY